MGYIHWRGENSIFQYLYTLKIIFVRASRKISFNAPINNGMMVSDETGKVPVYKILQVR